MRLGSWGGSSRGLPRRILRSCAAAAAGFGSFRALIAAAAARCSLRRREGYDAARCATRMDWYAALTAALTDVPPRKKMRKLLLKLDMKNREERRAKQD